MAITAGVSITSREPAHVTPVSRDAQRTSLGSLLTTVTGTPEVQRAAALATVVRVPADGATYVALAITLDASSCATRPVIEVYGYDRDPSTEGGVWMPLLSQAGDRQITADGTVVALNGTSLYGIAESKAGQFLIDLRGCQGIAHRVPTAGATGPTAMTLYVAFI